MRPSDFQSGFPGKLVRTSFVDVKDGKSRTIAGEAFIPDILPPSLELTPLVGRLFPILDRAKTNLLRLEAAVESLPEPKVLLAAMRNREAQSSSKIENTFASLKEVALAAVSAQSAREPALEVYRNRQAIESGLNSRWPIGKALLCEMHRVLITDPRKRPGQLRNVQVCIGDDHHGFEHARFVPPPASHVEECFRGWEEYVRSAAELRDWPYFASLALSHYQFETIHPFSDGNGRLGRAIVNLSPVKDGVLKYPVCNLSEWVHEHRQEYYDRLLRVSTHGDWEGWIFFFCTALAEQASSDLQRAERVRKLYKKYQSLVADQRKNGLLLRLIDLLFSDFAVSTTDAAKRLGITYTTAQKYVEYFVKEGVLVQAEPGNYAKVYVAMEVLRTIRGQGEE